MKKFLYDIKKLAAGWFLVFFTGYLACATLFSHTHLIDGVKLTHSHPYSDASDTGRHTHTATELATIASLSALLTLAPAAGCLFKVVLPCAAVARTLHRCSYCDRAASLPALRGPPAR